MLGTRELSIDKLPESSRNWINEKLDLHARLRRDDESGQRLHARRLADVPPQQHARAEHDARASTVTRPEIYFGEMTNTDVYVKTRQNEFNYPQGDTNSVTSYEGTGGIVLGGFFRRLLIALDRGDLDKLPFSDDVTRRQPAAHAAQRPRARRGAGAVPDLRSRSLHGRRRRRPAAVDDGRVHDVGQLSVLASLPARTATPSTTSATASRRSIDAYDGTTTFYVFDAEDPIIAAYRGIFPTLFKDASAMPAGLRKHVRYPELQLELQAAVYGLYHMTDPGVFYNREDLWTVASEVRAQTAIASRRRSRWSRTSC